MTAVTPPIATPVAHEPPLTEGAIRSAEAEVDLNFLEGQLNYRLLFGRPEFTNFHEHHFGITQRTAVFRSGARFGLDLWEGRVVLNRYREPVVRTGEWRVFVLEVGAPGERVSRVPQVRPGAHILLEARGVRRCKFLLRWLAELEMQGDLADLPREFFLSRDLWFRGVAPKRCSPGVFGWSRHADRG